MEKSPSYNIIGNNIKSLREGMGISQDRLSKLTDLSLNTIVKVESGKNRNPTIKTLSKIAKTLRVRVDNLIAVLLIFLLFGFSSYGYCQENDSPNPVILSLQDAIAVAFKNNKDIQIQEKEITVAKANIMGARSEFLPQVNAQAGYTRNGAVLSRAPVPNAKKDIGIFTGYKNDNQAGITVTESIYNGGANIANFKQAKIDFIVQEETLRAKKLDIEFEAKRLYYGLLLGYETLRITQELLDNANKHCLDVKNRFEQGASSKFDLLQSKVQVSLYIPELVRAKNAIDLLMADLKKLLSLKMRDEIALKDSRLEYSLIEIREDEFLKSAYLNSPEMSLKSLGIDISKWSIEMAKAGWRPQLNANLGYSFNSDNWSNMYNSKHSNWYSGFSVGMSIFDGFSTKAKVDAAKARYAQANLSKENLSDQIAVDVRQACLDLKQAQAIIDSQKDNIGEAREALSIAGVSYDNGENTNLDVLDAQLALSQAEESFVQGIYDYLMAQAYLDRTMGVMFLKGAEDEKRN
jgi:outer membrane protein